MKGSVVVGLLAGLAGACSDGHGRGVTGGPGSPDGGAPGSPDGGAPFRGVTIATGAPPALIVYREETAGEWKTPASPSTARFELDVTGPYRVIVVCVDPDSVSVTQLARTLDDEHTFEQHCDGPPAYPFHARGQMLQAGSVSFGNQGIGQSATPWTFELPTTTGTFDLVALSGSLVSGPDHVAIRRDIAVTGDLNLGTIDVAQPQAQAMVPTLFTASNLAPGESLSARLTVQSGNTVSLGNRFSQAQSGSWQVNLVPETALRATDTQDVNLVAISLQSDVPEREGRRSIIHRVRHGDPTRVTLMDPLAIAFVPTADRLVASWTSLPDCDEIDVSQQGASSDPSLFVVHDFLLSRAFLAGTSATSATLDFTDVPGFRPEWRLDPAIDQVFTFLALRGTLPDDHTSSGVIESHPAPTPLGAGTRRVDLHAAMAQIDDHLQRLQRATRPGAR